MKKKKIVVVSIVIIFIIGIIIFFCLSKSGIFSNNKPDNINGTQENNNYNDSNSNSSNDNNNLTEIKLEDNKFIDKKSNGVIKDKETNQIIYDPKEQYNKSPLPETPKVNTATEAQAAEIAEYTKYFLNLYQPQPVSSKEDFTIDNFSNEDIAAIVALSSRLYEPRTEKEIQEIAKRYFNIDNYKLPTGTYDIKNYGKFTVSESNKNYIWSGLKDKVEQVKTTYINKLEINDNQLILFLDEANDTFVNGYPGCYSPINPKNECASGFFKIYLTYVSDKVLTVDKIEYKRNPNYIEP